jgi:flagellar biosynthesis/type III secretory pathway protein FliH
LSNSTLTPKEKLSAYQRWEMNDFQQPGGGAQPKARTSAEEEAAKTRQAYDAAFEAGRAEGMRQAAEKTSLEAQQFAAFIDDLRHQQTDTSAAISDEILGLAGSDYATVVACAAGYRTADDKYATMPKVRFKTEDVVVRV